ncbi:multicopper oxidase domain-containing protein [Guyparkeria sp.]|uniref:multicopper oxidase domain-containing protein n=1 Tax=Guyparkeria sp. TaxID=2035736 RepID=UPI003970F5C5
MKRLSSIEAAVIAAAAILLYATVPAQAVVVNLPAAKDNSLYQQDDETPSNGAGSYLFSGNTKDGFARRAVVHFDIAAGIPAGSVINSVTLQMHVSRTTNNTSRATTLHRLLADWGEGTSNADGEEGEGDPPTTGDATWLHTFYPGSLWATPGGDFVGTATASVNITGNGVYAWTGGSLVTEAQAWLDNPTSNFGWLIRGVESTVETAKRFDSRENGTAANRPVLIVDYTPGGTDPTGACCYADTCEVLTAAACASVGGTYQGDDTLCSPDPCPPPPEATGACCFDNGTCDTLTAAQCLAQGGTYNGDDTACAPDLCPVVLEPFVDALPIPATAVPTTGVSGGAASYVIDIVEFEQLLHRDLPPTTVWGYDSLYPGPTIEASVDNPVTVVWVNNLRDSNGVLRTSHYLPVDLCLHGPDSLGTAPRTVAHLHGGHVEAASDGYPEDTILPGEQQTFFYENHQLPATLWYHDHALGITRLNVMMGLAGFYLLRDPFEQSLGLPSGSYEIGMAIQDRKFNADGSLNYPAAWQEHFFGDKILVNGKVWPYLNVDQGKYRFRWLNGSNSRSYTLSLSDASPFHVIGTEGGLLTAPVLVDSLTITPGERMDVVVDFSGYPPGTEIILKNSASERPGSPGVGVIPDVMKFIVQAQVGHTEPLPPTLRPVVAIPDSLAVVQRDFHLMKMSDPCTGSMWTINGLHWGDITEKPVINTTEIWRFINPSGMVHPMHIHLVMFQVLDVTPFTVVGDSIVAGTPREPDPTQRGWKDTVPVYPNEMVRVIATFENYLGKFAYHCHLLEHEDHEMMRQFEVVIDSTLVGVDDAPPVLSIKQSYPNPFNPSTRIDFEVPTQARTRLDIYDVAGRRIATLVDDMLPAGSQSVTWDGRDSKGEGVASGVYFYRLSVAGQQSLVRKMVLLK